jgi:hypothetical protein
MMTRMWSRRRRSRDAATELARRFALEYRGEHDAADALYWLEHPDEKGPSGSPSPSRPLIELRRALYRPDVTAADHERYEAARALVDADFAVAAAARDGIVATMAAERARVAGRQWPRVAAVATTAVVVVAGAVTLGSTATGSAPAPTPTASLWIGVDRFPLPAISDPPDQGGSEQWTAGSQQVTASAAGITGSMQVETDPVPKVFEGAASSTGASGYGILQLHPTPVSGVQRVTVAVTCASPGTYSWIAAGVPNGNGISGSVARSGKRSCAGSPSVVTEKTTGDPVLVQITGPSGAGFDAYAGEFR